MVYLMTMPVIQDYTGRVISINLFCGVRTSQYRPTCADQLRATEIHSSAIYNLFIDAVSS